MLATLMAVCKDRDTKAELNHRGQACEVLVVTGISRREKWTGMRVAPLYSGLEDPRVALNTYARLNS